MLKSYCSQHLLGFLLTHGHKKTREREISTELCKLRNHLSRAQVRVKDESSRKRPHRSAYSTASHYIRTLKKATKTFTFVQVHTAGSKRTYFVISSRSPNAQTQWIDAGLFNSFASSSCWRNTPTWTFSIKLYKSIKVSSLTNHETWSEKSISLPLDPLSKPTTIMDSSKSKETKRDILH